MVQAAPGADADQHRDGAGAHQVEPRGVGGATADDDRDRHLADELLQVERLAARGDVLGRDHGPLDHEDVESRVDGGLVVRADALGGERGTRHHALVLDLADALRHEILAHGLRVDALHLRGGQLLRQSRDPLELGIRVVVAGPDPLEVQNPEAAELPDRPRGRGRDHAVHRRGEERELEPVGPERPGDVDIVRVAGAPRGHYRDVIEAVRATALLAPADLNFHWAILGSTTDERLTLAPPPQPQPTRVEPPPRPPPEPSAEGSIRSTLTSGRSRSTSRRSTTPAPKCWVDSAPQATAKRRQSSLPLPE